MTSSRRPFTFFDNLFRRPRSAIAMGCWGAALALLIGSVVSNAIAGLLGFGFLLAAPTALAIVLNNVLIRAWIGAFSAAQPRLRTNAQGLANPYAMMFGEAIGAIVAWRADGAVVPVVLAVIFIVVSFVVVAGGAGKPLPNPMPLILFVGAGIVRGRCCTPDPAHADDGGWCECATASGEPCSQLGFFKGWWEWRKSAGADIVIRQGRVGGTFSALGCLFGCLLGGGLAAIAAAFSSSATGGLGTAAAGATPPGAARRRAVLPGVRMASLSLGQPPAGPARRPAPAARRAARRGARRRGLDGVTRGRDRRALRAPPPGGAATTWLASITDAGRARGNVAAGPASPPLRRRRAHPPSTPRHRPRHRRTPRPRRPTRRRHAPPAPHDTHPTSPRPDPRTGAGTPAPGTPARHTPEHPTASPKAPKASTDTRGQPADVTPPAPRRHAPDVTPSGSAPGAGTPRTRHTRGHTPAHPTASPKAPKACTATPANPPTSRPPALARHAPDVTPGHGGQPGDVTPNGRFTLGARRTRQREPSATPPTSRPVSTGQASDITPTGATRGAPDVTPGHPGAGTSRPRLPRRPSRRRTPGRRMLDDVLPDEDKFDEEDEEAAKALIDGT